MESRHWNAPSGVSAARPEEPPYAGAAGQTRVEVAQLSLPSGQAVSVQVHRVVNVATDPHLGTPALAGILHRYDVGFELGLAVEFVYHDPTKRRFALVVPDSLRHEELRLRAKLLEQIAEDASNPAPAYVRDATTVVGVQALREYLERGDGRAAIAAAESDLARRERELGAREAKLRERETALKVREERLVKRAEGVTSREDELAARAEEIEASIRDLGNRERDIAARTETLYEAEQRFAAREREMGARASAEPPRSLLDAVVRASTSVDAGPAHAAGGGSPVLFGGPLAPLGTSIGHPPSQAPVASQPGALSSSASSTTPAIAPVAARIDAMETRRVVLTPAGQLAGASAVGAIPSLGAPSPHVPPGPQQPAPPAPPAHAPAPFGGGPIPSLSHPLAASAPAPAPFARAIESMPTSPASSAHNAPTAVVANPASAGFPAGPGASPATPTTPSRARAEASPPSAETALGRTEDDDEDVVDASDLVVESTGFVRLEEVEELAEEEDVEELDVIDEVTGVTGIGRPPTRNEPRARESSSGAAKAAARPADGKTDTHDPITQENAVDDGQTSVAMAPRQRAAAMVVPGAWWRSGSQAHVHVSDGSVRYFFRADDASAQSVDAGCEVRCQLSLVDGAPVVLLTLVVGHGASARALARAALDTGREEERRVLDTLRRAYRFQVVPVDGQGRAISVLDAASAREVNVARMVERLARFASDRDPGGAVLSLRAVDRALSSPPLLHDPDEPFTAADGEEPASARDALAAVERLQQWSAPERLERVLLGLSVPNDRVDAVFRRTLESAVKFGVALPEPLERRAIALGVAADRGALVSQQIASFGEVVAGRRPSGLEREQARENWASLVNVAADADVAVDAGVADLVATELDLGQSAAAAAPPPDPGVLALLDTGELLRRLDTGPGRDVIALELCRRSATGSVESLGRAIRKMSRDEVVRVVPSMLRLGESVGDVLVEGLGAREPHVRQVAALGLGVLRLRRAAVPLIHLLLSEATDTWREVARALGDFGPSAVRPIVRFLKEPKGKDDRLAEALAHLSRACLGDVERLARDESPVAAAIAQRALSMRLQVLERDEAVRAQRPLGEADDVTSVSHRFFEELNALGELRPASREVPTD